jgi:hypothetical protein
MKGWLARFAQSIADVAGATVKGDVMEGSETLGARPTPRQRARWIKDAMDRLDAAVDEDARHQRAHQGSGYSYSMSA